jgi:hypothetical protein
MQLLIDRVTQHDAQKLRGARHPAERVARPAAHPGRVHLAARYLYAAANSLKAASARSAPAISDRMSTR